MFGHLETLLLAHAHTMHLGLFAFVASFVEEVIAPIPSPIVMITTGSLAALQGYPIWALTLLSVLGTFGKTLGAIIVYIVADKTENVLLQGRIGRFLGISHEHIEQFGARLGGGPRDYVILTLLRTLPMIPSVVVSVGSGLLKVPMRLYITTTIIGTLIRDGFYLIFGYMGFSALGIILAHSATIETYLQFGAVAVVLAALVYIRTKRPFERRSSESGSHPPQEK